MVFKFIIFLTILNLALSLPNPGVEFEINIVAGGNVENVNIETYINADEDDCGDAPSPPAPTSLPDTTSLIPDTTVKHTTTTSPIPVTTVEPTTTTLDTTSLIPVTTAKHTTTTSPIPVTTVEPTTTTLGICPEGFLTVGKQCFKFFPDQGMTWEDANTLCQDEGLVLGHPDDPAAAVALRKLIAETYGGDKESWLGAKGSGSSVEWINSGTTISSINSAWWPGYPWESRGNRTSTDYCLSLLSTEWHIIQQPSRPYYMRDCQSKKDHHYHHALCQFACASEAVAFGSQCLTFSKKDDKRNWNDAASACVANGGRLAKLQDPVAVMNYAVANYYNVDKDYLNFYVGASDIAKEGSWVWTDREPLDDQFPWGKPPGHIEPDGGRGENCLVMATYSEAYVDGGCGYNFHYICEYDTTPPIPVTTVIPITTISVMEGCPVDDGFFIVPESGNQCIKLFIDARRSFEVSKTFCQEQGFELVKPINPEAMMILMGKKSEYGSSGHYYWIGVQRKGSEYKWIRDGTTLPTSDQVWAPGHPKHGKDCAVFWIFQHITGPYSYGDATCADKGNVFAMCEYTTPPIPVTTAVPTTTASGECPEGFIEFTSSGSVKKCYKFFGDSRWSWDQAQEKCHSQGLTLAKTEGDDTVALRNLLVNTYGAVERSWIGGRGEGTRIEWVRDGTTISKNNPAFHPVSNQHNNSPDKCLCILSIMADVINWPTTPYFMNPCSIKFCALCELVL